MLKSITPWILIGTAWMVTGAANVRAEILSIYVAASDLAAHHAQNPKLGDFYVLRFGVPTELEGRTIRRAYLELYIDAAAREIDGHVNRTPVLEVYALKNPFIGILDPNQFEAQSLPALRNIVVGSSRRVVVDITEIINSYIQNPAKNHGLVIGSLTNDREGLFSIRGDAFDGNGIAKITCFY